MITRSCASGADETAAIPTLFDEELCLAIATDLDEAVVFVPAARAWDDASSRLWWVMSSYIRIRRSSWAVMRVVVCRVSEAWWLLVLSARTRIWGGSWIVIRAVMLLVSTGSPL